MNGFHFGFTDISSDYIQKQLHKLSIGKATGLDSFSSRLLKCAAPCIAQLLTNIFNLNNNNNNTNNNHNNNFY